MEEQTEKWRMIIEKVENGLILEKGDGNATVYETEDDFGIKAENIVSALYDILDYFDFVGGRHDNKRIRIRIEHGDKVDCTNPNCEVCGSENI